jgi:citrate lyase subunit beta / citryl-CoA lyase
VDHPPTPADIVNGCSLPPATSASAPRRRSAAYESAHRNGHGAATCDGEMIDEATRKMAERIARTDRSAGYTV